MPYKYGVKLEGQSKLSFNSVVFATEEEADLAGRELLSRWFAPTGYKVVQTDDEVNYTIVDNTIKRLSTKDVELNITNWRYSR